MYRRIRDLREDKDLSQTKMASHFCLSQTGYSKYETGENDVPTSILIELASFHNTSVDYILELTDYKQPYPRKAKSAPTSKPSEKGRYEGKTSIHLP